MAIAIKGNRGRFTGTSPISGIITVSPSSEVLAGNLLLMVVTTLAGISPANINDTQGNIWQVDATVLNTSRVAICSSVLDVALQTSDVISLNVGISVTYNLDLEEFAGILSPLWTDVSATASGVGTALSAGPTAVTAQASELAIGAFAVNAAESSFTPGGSYTAFQIVSQTGLALLAEYLVLGSTAAQTVTGTAGTTGTWAGAIATYKGGAASPEQDGPPPFLTR